ncbi:MAG: AsmA family protein, partial [bacterium]
MKRAGKIGCGILIVLFVLLIIAVVAVQYILKSHLGPIIQAQLPPVKEKLQVRVLEVGGASVNLLGGSVQIDSIKVGNPQGFQEPTLFALDRFRVEIGIGKLIKAALRKEVDLEIPRIELRNAELQLIRNDEGAINLKVLTDTLNAGKTQSTAGTPVEKKADRPAGQAASPLPKIYVKMVDINTVFRYLDHAVSKTEPINIALKNSINIRNLATYNVGQIGDISITGALESDANLCKTDLKGHIAPIIDPEKPTFDIAGDVGHVDLRLIRPYMDMAGFGCDSLSLKVNIVCKDGVLDGKQSVLTLVMTKVLLTGDMPPGVNCINELTVPVPVEGTLSAPKVNLQKAVVKAIMDNLKGNAGSVISGAIGNAISKDKKG